MKVVAVEPVFSSRRATLICLTYRWLALQLCKLGLEDLVQLRLLASTVRIRSLGQSALPEVEEAAELTIRTPVFVSAATVVPEAEARERTAKEEAWEDRPSMHQARHQLVAMANLATVEEPATTRRQQVRAVAVAVQAALAPRATCQVARVDLARAVP